MIKAVTFLVAAVSFCATGLGLIALFASGLGFLGSLWLILAGAITLGGALSFAVQFGIQAGWTDFAMHGFKALPQLVLGIFCSLISWVGAAGGWAMAIDGEDIRRSMQSEEGAALVLPLTTFASGFADLQAEMEILSQQADDLARRETSGRVTCDGDTFTGEACGPKCRLRQRHAASLRSAKDEIAGVGKQARDIALDVASTDDAEAQRALYAEAAEVQGNSDQKRVAITLRGMASELSGPTTDRETGAALTCRDARFSEDLERMATRIETRVELPSTAPEIAEPKLSDTSICAARRALSLVGLASPCSHPVSDVPLFLALGIEGTLVLLAFAYAGDQRRRGLIRSELEEFMASTQERTPDEKRRLAWLLQAEGLYIWQGGRKGPFVAVPIDGSVEAVRCGLRFKRFVAAAGKKIPRCPIQEVDANWCEARADAFGPATRYDLYRMPRGVEDLFRRLERDMGLPDPE